MVQVGHGLGDGGARECSGAGASRTLGTTPTTAKKQGKSRRMGGEGKKEKIAEGFPKPTVRSHCDARVTPARRVLPPVARPEGRIINMNKQRRDEP